MRWMMERRNEQSRVGGGVSAGALAGVACGSKNLTSEQAV
jgi:hypothetical protein